MLVAGELSVATALRGQSLHVQENPAAAPSFPASPSGGREKEGVVRDAGSATHRAGHDPSRPAARETAWVVLAAGLGTRMKSGLPKILHPLCGRPLGAAILQTASRLPQWQLVVVTGHQADRVEEELQHWARRLGVEVTFARQQPQRGTGHAVQCALGALEPGIREVLVSYGDVPLLRPETLEELRQARARSDAALALATARLPNPSGYGRVVRAAGRGPQAPVVAVVEEKDATPDQRAIDEVNLGVYAFYRDALEAALESLRPDNAQGEYYLTDAVAYLARRLCGGNDADGGPTPGSAGGPCQGGVVAVPLADPSEGLGVNDRHQLHELEALLRQRARLALASRGVSFSGAPPAEVDPWAEADEDCTLYAGARLLGESRLGRGCTLGPGAWVIDSVLEPGVRVVGNVLVGCHVGRDAQIGPGVTIPAGARIAPQACIGQAAAVQALQVGGRR